MPQLDMQPQETLRRAGLYDLLRDFLPKLKLRETCLPSYSRKSGKDLVFQSTRIWATTCMDRTLILILVYFVEYLSSNKRQKKKNPQTTQQNIICFSSDAQILESCSFIRDFPWWEDPLEKEKATHSSILAWRIPWAV